MCKSMVSSSLSSATGSSTKSLSALDLEDVDKLYSSMDGESGGLAQEKLSKIRCGNSQESKSTSSKLCDVEVAYVSRKFANIAASLLRQPIAAKRERIEAPGQHDDMALASRHRMGARCCRKHVSYHQATMSVDLHEQNKTVRLCMQCRRDHWIKSSKDPCLAKQYDVRQRQKGATEKKDVKKNETSDRKDGAENGCKMIVWVASLAFKSRIRTLTEISFVVTMGCLACAIFEWTL